MDQIQVKDDSLNDFLLFFSSILPQGFLTSSRPSKIPMASSSQNSPDSAFIKRNTFSWQPTNNRKKNCFLILRSNYLPKWLMTWICQFGQQIQNTKPGQANGHHFWLHFLDFLRLKFMCQYNSDVSFSYLFWWCWGFWLGLMAAWLCVVSGFGLWFDGVVNFKSQKSDLECSRSGRLRKIEEKRCKSSISSSFKRFGNFESTVVTYCVMVKYLKKDS